MGSFIAGGSIKPEGLCSQAATGRDINELKRILYTLTKKRKPGPEYSFNEEGFKMSILMGWNLGAFSGFVGCIVGLVKSSNDMLWLKIFGASIIIGQIISLLFYTITVVIKGEKEYRRKYSSYKIDIRNGYKELNLILDKYLHIEKTSEIQDSDKIKIVKNILIKLLPPQQNLWVS